MNSYLLCDHLEECHKIAQLIETPNGSYWHAFLHRRECERIQQIEWQLLFDYCYTKATGEK